MLDNLEDLACDRRLTKEKKEAYIEEYAWSAKKLLYADGMIDF